MLLRDFKYKRAEGVAVSRERMIDYSQEISIMREQKELQ
jgi:hypothetical protein